MNEAVRKTDPNLKLYLRFAGSRAPFVRSGHMYFTDGAIILRVLTNEPESPEDAGPSAESLSQFDWGIEPGKLWNTWPKATGFAERVTIEGMMISGDYAELIHQLPGVLTYRAWPQGNMLLFRFGCGVGAVMRMRPVEVTNYGESDVQLEIPPERLDTPPDRPPMPNPIRGTEYDRVLGRLDRRASYDREHAQNVGVEAQNHEYNAATAESAAKMIRGLLDGRQALKADAERGDELTEAIRALYCPGCDAVYLKKRGWALERIGEDRWWKHPEKLDGGLRTLTQAVWAEVRELIGEQP